MRGPSSVTATVGVSADVGMAVRMAGYRSVIKVAVLVVAYG